MQFIKKFVKFEILALLGIIAIGGFLFLYKLNSIPSGFYVDEALSGYNAFSLLTTNKDEYGKVFPIALRFFGSYSPPLYTYLTIPFVSVLGLKVYVVRLVSAISGLLGILVTFYFLKLLNITKSKFSPFIGAILFAISPWTVLFSRVGYEMNLAFFVFSLGALVTWVGIKRESKLLVPGFLIFSLSTYAAHTEKFLVPVFFVALLLLFKKHLLKKQFKKYVIYGLVGALIIQLPNLYQLATPSFFSKSNLFYSNVVLDQADKIQNFLPAFISVPLAFIREFLSQYLTYFSPRSLFALGDADPQRSLPELSVFYHWMVVPYFVGIYFFWKRKRELAFKYVLLLTFLSPLTPALAGDPFSTQRALPLLLPLILIITTGIDGLIYKRKARVWLPIFIFLLASSFILLWRSYFVFLPKERAKVWGYGFKQLAEEIERRPDLPFVIDQARIKPAYIELAFYLKYPPAKFQKEIDQTIKNNYYTDTSFDSNYAFGNIETRNIFWEEDVFKNQILVGDEFAISDNQAEEHFLTRIIEIRDPIDQIVFQAYKTDPTKKCLSAPNNIHCKGLNK